MALSSSDRRELLHLLQVRHGSKSAAKAVFSGLAPEGQLSCLLELRREALERSGQGRLPLASEPSREASRPSAGVAQVGLPLDAGQSQKSSRVRKKPKKVPYNLLLVEEQLTVLRGIADSQGSSVSELIRTAIREYILREIKK